MDMDKILVASFLCATLTPVRALTLKKMAACLGTRVCDGTIDTLSSYYYNNVVLSLSLKGSLLLLFLSL